MYKHGDIVSVKFPFTDGSEFKKRPVLIISNNSVNETGDLIVVQVTSKFHDANLTIILNNIDCVKPLPLQSYLRIHKIFTVNETLILSKLSSIKNEFLKVVSKRINEIIEVQNIV